MTTIYAAADDPYTNHVLRVDTVANLRLLDPPPAGFLQAIIVESVSAGAGQTYRWSESSTATDDGDATIKPDSVASTSAGRWVTFIPSHDVDLAASTGSSLVGFLQSGTGAVARTVQSKLRDRLSASDFGFLPTNSASTNATALAALAAYVNGLTNTDGRQVAVFFEDGAYTCSAGAQFTRPVMILAYGAYIDYTGTGNFITLGPSGLSANSVVQKYYSVYGLGLTGGASADNGIYVSPWISDPTIRDCLFYDFGGSASYSVYCPYNNWNINLKDNEFYSTGTTARNFFRANGKDPDGSTLDDGNSRLNAIGNWVRWGGTAVGGIGYFVSGAKSHIEGGGVEGCGDGIVLGTTADYTEIDHVYCETMFTRGGGNDPCFLKSSASDDPSAATKLDLKGVRVSNIYVNLHNYDQATTAVFHKHNDDAIKLLDWDIDQINLIEKKYPLLNFPNTASGHRVRVGANINVYGDVSSKQSLAVHDGYATNFHPRLTNKIKNYIQNPALESWTTDYVATAAPFGEAVAATGIKISIDGAGGSYSITRELSDTANGDYQKVDYSSYFLRAAANTPAPGNTYFILLFRLNAGVRDIAGQRCVLSFMGRSAANRVISADLRRVNISSAVTLTAFSNSVTINSSGWDQYSMDVNAPEIASGVAVDPAAYYEVLLYLPPATVLSIDFDNVFLNVGGISYPLQAQAT